MSNGARTKNEMHPAHPMHPNVLVKTVGTAATEPPFFRMEPLNFHTEPLNFHTEPLFFRAEPPNLHFWVRRVRWVRPDFTIRLLPHADIETRNEGFEL